MVAMISFRRAARLGTLICAAAVVACGPIIATEDAGGTGSAGTTEPTSLGEASSTPECTSAVEQDCWCPAMARGTKYCEPSGQFGPCVCEPAATTDALGSTGGEGSSETGAAASSSSTGSEPPFEPVPCLPLDEPCNGPVRLETNADVVEAAACSRVAGSLIIYGGVTDLSPLACLRELGNQLYVEGVDIRSLSGLSNLERVEGELEVGWTGLTTLGLESLVYVNYLSLYENDDLVTLDLPNLELIEGGLGAHYNPLLSTCELESLAQEVVSPTGSAQYAYNAEDGCPSTPDPR